MVTEDFRHAALPLLEEGLVDAVEWNVDMGWGRPLPAWSTQLIDYFGSQDRLYAHGVELSVFSRELSPRQTKWLDKLREEVRQRRYVHLTEHYGFMTAGPFLGGTPLPMPKCDEAVRTGIDRVRLLQEIAPCPVGLENLALAFSARDARDQAAVVSEVLAETDGLLLLDLHNIYCQAHNFDCDAESLIGAYPLDRVREIHVAGGRWTATTVDPSRPFRRDSHDQRIPEEVFALLSQTLPRVPNLEVVIFERSEYSISGETEVDVFRRDYRRLCEIVGGP